MPAEVLGVYAALITATAALFATWIRPQGFGRASWAGQAPLNLRASGTRSRHSRYEEQMRQAAAQEERNRLARDLHDSIKQQLFAVSTAAATAEARFSADPAGALAAIGEVRGAARDSMAEMDALLDQLRITPLENTGLVDALTRQCEALRLRTGANIVCEVGALPPTVAMAPGAHLALFRMAQEALSNVARHSRASTVRVALQSHAGSVELEVADNGMGYRSDQHHMGMGLENIRARAEEFGGLVNIASSPGAGTRVTVAMPYAEHGALALPVASPRLDSDTGDGAVWHVGPHGATAARSLRRHRRRGSLRPPHHRDLSGLEPSEATPVTPLRLVLVDDHRVVTRSLKAWFESFPDFSVVGIAANGEELLAHLTDWRPDVIIQDLLMPGGLDGIETTKRVLAAAPDVKVVALTASIDEPRMMGVLRAGAVGYIRKDAEPETLLAAVRAVASGRTYIDPAVARVPSDIDRPVEPLTDREIAVLRQLVTGRSNKDIGLVLGIGEETVKTHVSHILAKLEVDNRAQAIAEAMRRRLVSVEDLD